MLDRVLKLIVTLTFALFFAQAVISVLAGLLASALGAIGARIAHAFGPVGSLLLMLAVPCFALGLVVRAVQFIGARKSKSAGDRVTRERNLRQKVRRPAEGIPPHVAHAEERADSDPDVGDGDD